MARKQNCAGTNGTESAASKNQEQSTRRGNSKRNAKRNDKGYAKKSSTGYNENKAAAANGMTSYPKSSMSNDFDWYNKNPSLTLGVGQIPYPYRPGMELDLGTWGLGTGESTAITPHHNVPGFMALTYIPTLGAAATYQDAVNVAAREIYAKVRDAYSGVLSVSAADLMMYVGAIDSIYSEISYLRRIYGIINSYTSENYNFPDAALYAMGFSKEQIAGVRADKLSLYTGINMLLARVRKYKLPSVMDLFKRHWWMAENIFADAPSLRSQMYFFQPFGAWKIGFNEQGTTLNYKPRNEAGMSAGVEGLLSFATELMDALDASEDAYTMNGYLQRAFSDVPSFTVEDMAIDYVVAPQYNPEVMLQIMNFTVPSGSPNLNSDWKYVQDVSKQIITDNILMTASDAHLSTSCNPALLLRQDVDNPMVGDTVIATRMMATMDYSRPGAAVNTYHVNFGTELPLGFRTANWNPWKQTYDVTYYANSMVSSTTDMLWSRVEVWNKYDHAPMLYVLEMAPGGELLTVRLMGDYYNPTTIYPGALADLHSVCALSELNAFGIYTK